MTESYVVAFYTFGSFQDWVTGPTTEEEARRVVAEPPEGWKPRRQDDLTVFRLEQVES